MKQVYIGIICVLLIVFSAILTSCSPLDIKADVNLRGQILTIQNQNDFAWKNIKLTLNDKYGATLDTLAPQEIKSYILSEFTMSNGTRFNYGDTKPLKFDISVDMGNDKWGYYHGTWN